MAGLQLTSALPSRRVRARVRGLVQGVGFRPFVCTKACSLGLTGWVRNDAEGVLIEVEGPATEDFLRALRDEAPRLARIDAIDVADRPEEGGAEFAILRSDRAERVTTAITPDAAVCDDCLAELFDPEDRRYRYPFINCTNCGPRYTIAKALPYDRALTSMAPFDLCGPCAHEYNHPTDRRFHAQPNACSNCGPRLTHSIEACLGWIRAGEVVAIKGLGGFHLVADARNAVAVDKIRTRKQRDAKPFAVMVAGPASARRIADVDPIAEDALCSPERPIVVLPMAADANLSPGVSEGLSTVGVMLPYTPIHYLLFHEAAGRPPGTSWLEEPQDLVLVMTSANPGREPLVIDDAEAAERLEGIADRIVGHDRAILTRCDDSVVRVIAGAPAYLRRARGDTPLAIALAHEVPPVLAVGAHLKATICITRGREAFVSQHIGDLENRATFGFLQETAAHLLSILDVEPVAVAHDLHPDFLSTRFAHETGLRPFAIQHHHAHVAAVAAEHGIEGPILGLALDGFGLGTDRQSSWGGELLLCNGHDFERLGHLAPLAQPGGDKAAREPWRMAAAALHANGLGHEITQRFGDRPDVHLIERMLQTGLHAPPTSSCGRLFDAACGLLGVRAMATFEGEAPMALEGLCTRPTVLRDGWRIEDGILDMGPLLVAIRNLPPTEGADLFHGTLAAALADWVAPELDRIGATRLAMSGGCAMNRVLVEELDRMTAERGVSLLLPRQAPANDGGLSLGQAWIAAEALLRERGEA